MVYKQAKNTVLESALICSATLSWMEHTLILIDQWKGNFKSQKNQAKSNVFNLSLVQIKHNVPKLFEHEHSDLGFLTEGGSPPLWSFLSSRDIRR